MNVATITIIVVLLLVFYVGIQIDNARNKREESKTYTQKGREKYKAEKRNKK